MSSGLSFEGFKIKRLSDIIDELTTALKAQFGNIDTDADSVFGQLIGVLSKPIADAWETIESVYYSRYPDAAIGTSLDYASGLTGATRLGATYSRGFIGLHGTWNTTVPVGTQFSTLGKKDIFVLNADTIINNLNTGDIFVTVETPAGSGGILYSVNISGTECGFTTSIAMTTEEIATQIKSNILSAFGSGITVTDYVNGTLRLQSDNTIIPMLIIVTPDILSWSSPGAVTALEIGAVTATAGELVTIETPVSGLDSVINYDDITAGRDLESDTAFRQRRLLELMISGAGTVESIRSKILQEVENVTDCAVFENDTDVSVGIMTPHSLQVVATGGNEQTIANKLWLIKPAGIATIGSVSKTVIDSMGLAHNVRFNRAYTRYAWVWAILTTFGVGEEETFPVDGADQVKGKIKDYGDTISMGRDVIPQRFYKPINEVSGIESTDLWISLPQYTLAIVDGTFVNLAALYAYLASLRTPTTGELFAVLGSGDTTDDALETAKGSAVVANDVFAILNLTTPAVTYVGNLEVDPTTVSPSATPYVQYNLEVAPTEHSEFSLTRITVAVAP